MDQDTTAATPEEEDLPTGEDTAETGDMITASEAALDLPDPTSPWMGKSMWIQRKLSSRPFAETGAAF